MAIGLHVARYRDRLRRLSPADRLAVRRHNQRRRVWRDWEPRPRTRARSCLCLTPPTYTTPDGQSLCHQCYRQYWQLLVAYGGAQ